MPSNHLILCCPLFLLPSIFPSIRVFSNESVLCIRWPKYWSFSFSISPANEYSGLISFRMDWFDILAGTPRDSQESSPAPQFENINSLVLSLPYGTSLTSVHDYWKKTQLYFVSTIVLTTATPTKIVLTGQNLLSTQYVAHNYLSINSCEWSDISFSYLQTNKLSTVSEKNRLKGLYYSWHSRQHELQVCICSSYLSTPTAALCRLTHGNAAHTTGLCLS